MVKANALASAAAALLLAPSALAESLYSKNSPVLQLDGRSYETHIAQSNHTAIVEFYAPWCGHCKNLQPAFEKAAKSLDGLAKVAAVNCDDELNKPFCGKMGVQGFPTLKVVRPGKKPGKPFIEDYRGERTAKAITDFVIDKIPNHVKKLKDEDYATWTATAGPKAILFSNKGTVGPLLKSIAIDFLGGIQFAQVRDKEKDAVEAFGIETFPTLVLLPGDGQDPITYDGEMKRAAMVEFLSQVTPPNPEPAPKAKKSKASGADKKKDARASSKLAEASASQASKQAKSDKASQTAETLEEEVTESPSPQVDIEPEQKPIKLPEPAPPIASLPEGLSLQQKCLNTKAGTCILVLLPESDEPSLATIEAIRSLSELRQKHSAGGKRNLFPFYQIPATNSQGASLRKKLGLSDSDVEVIAINGKREWYTHYPSSSAADLKLAPLENWLDAIRMGDLRADEKKSIPAGLVLEAADVPPEPVKVETPPELEAMRESLLNNMPEGMEIEIEEVSDEEYQRIMAQQGQAPSSESEPAIEHEEL